MTNHSTTIKMEERAVTDSNNRRRSTDTAQPLDYVTKELVSEFIEPQQQMAPPSKSIIQKLLKVD